MSEFTLIKAKNLFDGKAHEVFQNHAILISKGKIDLIGPSNEVRAPENAEVEVIDYGDATVLPGLVDGHTHMMAPGDGTLGDDVALDPDNVLLGRSMDNAKVFLDAGVTTARENGSKNKVGFYLRDNINAGKNLGPEMVVCGRPITIRGGHMWYCGSEAETEKELRSEVRQLVKEGADFIKIMATGGTTRTSDPLRPAYTSDDLRIIVDEAHAANKLTATHCSSVEGIANSLNSGVDMIIHCAFVDETGMYKYRDDLAEKLASANAWVNPTIHVIQATMDRLNRIGKERGWLTPEEDATIERSKLTLEQRVDTVRRLSKLGVRMIAGSDSPWGSYPPGEFVKEIIALHKAGLSNSEALITATSLAAESIAAGNRAGVLQVGRPADVLIVDGNPLEDLNALWNIKDVYKAGKRVIVS